MLGVLGHTGEGLTLREICQRFDGLTYHQEMLTAKTVAGLWNVHGGLDGKAVRWQDLTPEHSNDDPVALYELEEEDPNDPAFLAMGQAIMRDRP